MRGYTGIFLVFSLITGSFCVSKVSFETFEMPITDATMYESSCQLQRQVQWKGATSGEHLLEFRGLPVELDESTFFIKTTGDVLLMDTTVAVRVIEPEDNPDLRVKELQGKHKESLEKLLYVEQQIEKVNQRLELVKDFAKSFIQTANKQEPKALFAEFKELLKASDDVASDGYNERASLESEKSQLEQQANDLHKQVAALLADKKNIQQVKDVTVRIRIPNNLTGPLSVLMAYHQHGCSWRPEYEIKVSSTQDAPHAAMPVSIEYFARVKQITSEDWTNVQLTLATNAPHRTAQAPTLHSKYATTRGPYRRKAYGATARFASVSSAPEPEMAALDDQVDGDMMMDVEFDAADISSTGTLGSYSFDLSAKVNIVSSRQRRGASPTTAADGVRVLVDKILLQGRPFVWAVPSESQVVYFQLLCKNSRTLPILQSGKANVYLDEALVAQANIPHTPVGEILTINLGEDRGVKMTHRPMKITSNTDGIISKSRTRPYDTLTAITNQNTQPQAVIVGQALPKADNSNIHIELVKPSPGDLQHLAAKSTRSHEDEFNNMLQDLATKEAKDKPKVFNYLSKATGIVYWVTILPPRETINVPFQYKLTWPESIGEVYIQNHYM